MRDVFISYPSENKNIADAVCHYLESASIKCWYAPRDIKAGMVWEDAIMDAIGNCKVFILIFSEKTNQSKHVINEVREAFKAQCTIIPFRIDDSQMSRTLSYYLDGIHWLDAMDAPLESNIEKLCQQIISIIGKPQDSNIDDTKIIEAKQNAQAELSESNFTNTESDDNLKIGITLICGLFSILLVITMFYIWSTYSPNNNMDSPHNQTTGRDNEPPQTQTTSSDIELPQDQTTNGTTESPQEQTTNSEQTTTNKTQTNGKKCMLCSGTGKCFRCHGNTYCTFCDGTGKVNDFFNEGICNACNGTGVCHICDGSGLCSYCVATENLPGFH